MLLSQTTAAQRSRPCANVAAWLSNKSMGGHTPTTYGAQGSFFVGMGGFTPTTY